MTLSAANPFEEYTIVDSDAPLAFPYPWEFADEILVTENGTIMDIGTDYTLTGTGAPGGGQVNPVAAVLGSKWRIYRLTRLAQTAVPSDSVVGFALDRLTKQAQDARRDIDRSVKTEGETPQTALPTPVAGKGLIGKSDATGYELTTTSIEPKFTSLDGQIAALAAADAAEIVARNDGDSALALDIIAEETARIQAVNDEATIRADQDNVLMGLILADGGLADPEDLKEFLGVDVIEDNLTAATSDITTLQAEMDVVEAAILTKLDASAVSAFVLTLLDDPNASAFLTSLGVSTFVKGILDDADASAVLTTLGFSTYGKTLIDDADASAAQTTLGISTYIKTLLDDADASAAQSTLGISTFIKTLLDDANAGAAQTTLGISTFIKALLDDTTTAQAFVSLGGTSGGGWFSIFGFKVQWGSSTGTVAGGAGGATITMPSAFSSASSWAHAAINGDNATGNVVLGNYPPGKTASQFISILRASSTNTPVADGTAFRIDWVAIGT